VPDLSGVDGAGDCADAPPLASANTKAIAETDSSELLTVIMGHLVRVVVKPDQIDEHHAAAVEDGFDLDQLFADLRSWYLPAADCGGEGGKKQDASAGFRKQGA
jgi:hypothetical protein